MFSIGSEKWTRLFTISFLDKETFMAPPTSSVPCYPPQPNSNSEVRGEHSSWLPHRARLARSAGDQPVDQEKAAQHLPPIRSQLSTTNRGLQSRGLLVYSLAKSDTMAVYPFLLRVLKARYTCVYSCVYVLISSLPNKISRKQKVRG